MREARPSRGDTGSPVLRGRPRPIPPVFARDARRRAPRPLATRRAPDEVNVRNRGSGRLTPTPPRSSTRRRRREGGDGYPPEDETPPAKSEPEASRGDEKKRKRSGDDPASPAKSPKKRAPAAAAAPDASDPPADAPRTPEFTIDPETGKATSEINVKGNEGRVIGKGGETIRHIESSHGVKIEMRRDRGVAAIVGPPAVMPEVARYIAEVIEKGDTGRASRNVPRDAPDAPTLVRFDPVDDAELPEELRGDPQAHVAIEVPCPGQEGRVIGKGGATIKEIERQSGATMKVEKGSGKCDIKGSRRVVIAARRAVLETLALSVDRFVGSGGGATMQGDWTCPSCRANVFASKTNCFSCGAPRPAEASGGGYRGGAMGGAMGMGAMGGAMGGAWAARWAARWEPRAAPWAPWAAPWAPWAARWAARWAPWAEGIASCPPRPPAAPPPPSRFPARATRVGSSGRAAT